MQSRSVLARIASAVAIVTIGLGCVTQQSAFEAGQPETLVDAAGVALDGYDPVAYFVDGEARRGDREWQAIHSGATYLFTGDENRAAFLAEPDRFVPAYGGWCAWALADGEGTLVEVDPESFVIQDGRLLLFFDGFLADTRRFWLDGDAPELANSADGNWERLVAERP